MKKLIVVALAAVLAAGCNPKKPESTPQTDAPKDSTIQADQPAPSSLAFAQMTGYSAKNIEQQDSVKFTLITSQEELDKTYAAEKNSGAAIVKPDFIINYIIGVTLLPSQIAKTILVEKAEVQGDEISVYVSITNGEKLKIAAKASQVFAVERRDGIATIQFYINGKKGESFFMTGM